MTSELFEFKSRRNHYGVIVTWGGFMKKLSHIGAWSGKEVLKDKREWCKANARGAFLQVYNKTSFRADQS